MLRCLQYLFLRAVQKYKGMLQARKKAVHHSRQLLLLYNKKRFRRKELWLAGAVTGFKTERCAAPHMMRKKQAHTGFRRTRSVLDLKSPITSSICFYRSDAYFPLQFDFSSEVSLKNVGNSFHHLCKLCASCVFRKVTLLPLCKNHLN